MPRVAQRNASVPPAAVRRPGRKQTLLGFYVFLDPNVQDDQIWVAPTLTQFNVNPRTWSWARNDNAVLSLLVHEKAEAVRTMQTRMVDVSSYSTQPTVPAKRPKPATLPTGIKALCLDIQTLVGEMAAAPTASAAQQVEFATRYGKYRDTMASLRTAFMEAEGSFETAQLLLVQMMGDDQ